LAQNTGSITGTVYDKAGAVVAGAEVKVENTERGISRTTTTNADGIYLVSGLPGAMYDVTVKASGFQTFKASQVELRVAQKIRVDANLAVGAVTTEVTVEGTAVAQVETQSSDLAGTVTGKQISQLELNGRNFAQLTTLVPGVSNQTGQDEGTVGIFGNVSYSFNGGRTEYNNWELNGGDNMDNGSNTTLNVYPSVDAIAEVRVLTSNYGAQYGRNGSGTVEVETKSGTSKFHGSAYEFVRNDAFNARNYFESSVPPYKKNDFGYTFGGPVYIPGKYNSDKQKTFFFWSQEWRKNRVPEQVFNVPVPSMAERAGNFSALCPGVDCPINPATGQRFLNDTVPVDPSAAAMLALIPQPNAAGDMFNASPSTPTNWREELLRVDHNFSSKLRGMFSYVHDSWDTVTPTSIWTGSSFPTVQTRFKGPALSLVARLSATISPKTLNEFVFGYTTDHIIFTSTGFPTTNAWQRPSDFQMGAFFDNGFGGKLPTINLGSSTGLYGGGFYEDPNGEWPEGPYNSNPTYTYRDMVSMLVGKHNLFFGAYAVTAQKNELSSLMVNGSLNFSDTSAVTTGNPFADFLTGRIDSYSQGSNQIKAYHRYKILEPFFQDDWRITSRLTLSLGVRLSLFGTYREKYLNAYNWDPAAWSAANAPVIDGDGSVTGFAGALVPGTGNPFNGIVRCGYSGVPVGCMSGHLFNPAPRIGFAWDPRGNGKTAIRGGYGIFYEHTNGNESNEEGLISNGQSSPLLRTSMQYNVIGYSNLGAAGGGTVEYPLSFLSIPNKILWPYVQQWHLDIQHEVAKNTVAMISYVGSKGTHLNRIVNLNQIRPVADAQNPYKVGEAIGASDCETFTTPSGVAVTGQAAINLAVACGANPDLYRPYTGAGNITRVEDMGSSTYHAFQASVRRTVGALQVNAAYTWSHSIDDSSSRYDTSFADSYNPSANRASSSFDVRHMLNISYIYDMPFFKKQGWTRTALGGWQLSGITSFQTGTPFSVVYGADNAGVGNGVGTGSYADIVSDPNSNIPSENVEGYGPLVANPNAFAVPRGLTFGNSGRNILRNPNTINFNMALFKHFTIKESTAFEFRAEAFNVFNHTQWAPINGDAGSAAYNGLASYTNTLGGDGFLHVGAAHAARILQLGLKFIF
jgi:hypothetical protein